ncbi:MAG: ABC transporter ATP-binding protein [Candidatus Woesearchaeota archaeon]
MELIRLKEVAKRYYKKDILTNVNFSVEEGDILGVIGTSGSGKTTLLNLMTGFIKPTNGQVFYFSKVTDGPQDLHRGLHKLKKHIGFTPQHNSFYPKLTVKENLFHFGKLYKVERSTLVYNIKNLLEVTGLLNHREKLAEHLSEGMQRRLDIACSLVHKPKLLVLDEPTADLDPLIQKDILNLLVEVNKLGVTIVMASHQLESVEKICNKVAIVHESKVHSHGLMDEIKKPFLKENFTINLKPGENRELLLQNLRTLPIKKIVDQGSQLVIYPDDIQGTVKGLLHFLKEENLYFNDMDVRKPSLNEIFERINLRK